MVRWDRDKIVAALIDRRSRGLALNRGAIQESDASLLGAIVRHFRSFDEALLAAGIDPAAVRTSPRWDEARVVAALKARRDAGLGLSRQVIVMEDAPLSGGIARYFGSCDAALRAAGIDPELMRKKLHRWDKAGILAALRDRQARGFELNAGAVDKLRPGLYRAAFDHFGSYDAALRAAGIDPGPIRQRRADWDRPAIIEALCARRDKGLALNAKALERSEPSLYLAICRHFESHDAALRAVGVNPATVRKSTPWDKQKVVVALRQRQGKGLEMHVVAIRAEDMRLSGAIAGHYGSHDEALRAAGIDPDNVRKKQRSLDNGAIFAALRAIARDDRLSPAMVNAADKRLIDITRNRFGSFQAAVIAAGLTYFWSGRTKSQGVGHWTEHRVLQTLRDLHKDGHDLRYRAMKTNSQPLFFAARKLFGSYANAVREAGIDYWQMSQAQLAKDRAAAKIAAGESDH
jgi:hypothetical protein